MKHYFYVSYTFSFLDNSGFGFGNNYVTSNFDFINVDEYVTETKEYLEKRQGKALQAVTILNVMPISREAYLVNKGE